MRPKPREMWEKGMPLSEAVLKWCDPQDREIFERQLPDDYLALKEGEKPFQTLSRMLVSHLEIKGCQRQKANALEIMREEILLKLFNEELLAYGFAMGRNDRSPRLISPEFWYNAKVDWEQEIVDNGNSKFNRLRIIDPYEYPELELQPKIGRPTKKEKIYSACKELFKRDNGFFQLVNKTKVQKVREYIKHKHPEIDVYGPSMGDDAIRKRIKEFKDKYVKY